MSPVTWRDTTGRVLVDIVRTAPPSHPLTDGAVLARITAVRSWSQRDNHALAGVRILSLAAPATSLLHDAHEGLTALAGTVFAPALIEVAR